MKQWKRCLAVSMAAIVAMTSAVVLPAPKAEAAKKKVKLGSKKLTVQVGKTKTLKLKNNKKKVKWTVVSGKNKIKLKSKKKTSVKIVGKKKGTAKVQAKIGKKKYTCKVTVKAVATKKTTTSTSRPGVTATPRVSTRPNPVVTQDDVEALAKNVEVDGILTVQNRGILLRITNNNKRTLHRVTVNYSLYKTSTIDVSNRLASVTGDVYELKAGETKYEYCPLYIAADASIARQMYEVGIDQSKEYIDVRPQIEVSGTPGENAVDKTTNIVKVSVKNKSSYPVDNVTLLVVFYKDGYVLDVCKQAVAGGLGAGDTQVLEMYRTSVDESGAFADCDSYQIWYEALKN